MKTGANSLAEMIAKESARNVHVAKPPKIKHFSKRLLLRRKLSPEAN